MEVADQIISEFPKLMRVAIPHSEVLKTEPSGRIVEARGPCTEVSILICETLGYRCALYPLTTVDESDIFFGGQLGLLDEYYYPYSTYPYEVRSMSFMSRFPDYTEKTFQFISTFTLSVWMSIIMSMVLATAGYYYIFHRRVPLLLSLFYIWNTFCGQNRDWKPKSYAQKVLVLSWSIGIMFITLSYGSVLLSTLTTPHRVKGIEDFTDLYHGLREGKAKVTEFKNVDTYILFNVSIDEKIRFIGEELERSWKVATAEDLFYALEDGYVIIAADDFTRSFSIGSYFISKDEIIPRWPVIILREPSCCMNKINKIIQTIWSAGLNIKIEKGFSNINEQITLRWYRSNSFPDESPVHPLNLSDLSGAFVILAVGLLLGLICFILELQAARISKLKCPLNSSV